jgi:hypothetical protein
MRGKFHIIGGIALALGANASAQSGAAASSKDAEPTAALQSLVQSCSAHKFETTILVPGEDGKSEPKKVRMCGTEGQSDADWILTLNDAAKKAIASSMPQVAKDQIVAAVAAEVARLKAAVPQTPSTSEVAKASDPGNNSDPSNNVVLSRDYASLPPLPSSTNVPPPSVLSSAAAGTGAPKSGGALPMTGPAPRLTLRCAIATDRDRSDDCDSIEPQTLLVLRADEALPNGVQMRFLRRGTQRAELDLPPLKRGQTTTLGVPPEICAGVSHSKVEIQAGGGSMGEYDLRC